MHRTQIYLEEEKMQLLRLEARKERLTLSELIRRALDRWLEESAKEVDWETDSLSRAAGSVRIGAKDVSIHHDHYLYGKKKGA